MGFLSKKPNHRLGLIIDIGSGSVLVAVVASDPAKSHPDIVWSKREHTPQRLTTDNNSQHKSVLTSLINVMMAFDSEGRAACRESSYGHNINNVQVNISAPWSYTVTKTIAYQNEEEFMVSKSLVDELLRTAHLKVEEELQEKAKINDLGLEILVKSIMKIVANGYAINLTDKQRANDLKIIEASAVAQKRLIEAVKEIKNKVLPEASLKKYSFTLPYYYVINSLNPANSSYCLVDITYEATEIGIVREGVLTYCSHIAVGTMSLAREIAEILSVPIQETFGYLKSEGLDDYLKNCSANQQDKVNEIFAKYQDQLTTLFKETGDSLTVPKKIYLHSNLNTESFFNEQITKAANQSTKLAHATYNVTSELLTKMYPKEYVAKLTKGERDTGLLISAQFFHTVEYETKFDQL
ncbi:MAG TPA: hypothetical protein PKA42_02065 [Candidatus Paceibacterota bacterium]|nr:hypothetical protein [Candidatus Paceibacterota bacterium]